MKRGELYRVLRPSGDPKKYRTVVIVSRQALLESRFSSVICAPVFSYGEGLLTQVPVGPDEGLKHTSWIMCDNLVSLQKSALTQYVGSLAKSKVVELDDAMRAALDLR
jgi:mRNA interferase MazF